MDRTTASVTRKKLHRTVNQTLKQAHLFPNDARILLACSGGPDSMVLLDVLLALSIHRKSQWHIAVATMNHAIRTEGVEELLMVSDYCRERHVPFYGTTIDIPKLARERTISLETAGRMARYDWLLDIARQEGYDYIATAHHKDDQSETIVSHVIRGSGLQGLVGMDVVNDAHSIPIVRPLLGIQKWEIIEYAELSSIPYCIDMSNYDTSYTRNRIRHLVMPELEAINPNVTDALCRLGAMAKEDAQLLDLLARNIYDELVETKWMQPNEGTAILGDVQSTNDYMTANGESRVDEPLVRMISRRALRTQPLALQRRIWQLLCMPIQLTWAHQQQLEDIVNTGEPKTLQIREVTISAQCDTIQVYCKD